MTKQIDWEKVVISFMWLKKGKCKHEYKIKNLLENDLMIPSYCKKCKKRYSVIGDIIEKEDKDRRTCNFLMKILFIEVFIISAFSIVGKFYVA